MPPVNDYRCRSMNIDRVFGFDRADLQLLVNIWRMMLADRYLGSAFGVVWAILNPLLMLAIFTFVFGFVYKTRLPGADTTWAYSIWLICGYGPWLANTEAITAASNSIISNVGLVKNMAFRTELLPVAAALLGLVPLSVSLCFLMMLQLFTNDLWSWQLLWLPALIAIQFLFLASVGVFLSLLTTFIRDFGIALPNLLLAVLFATPIFYSLESVPPLYAIASQFNPIFIISDAYRSILLAHTSPNWLSLSVLAIISLGLLHINLKVFRRVKGYLPSVI